MNTRKLLAAPRVPVTLSELTPGDCFVFAEDEVKPYMIMDYMGDRMIVSLSDGTLPPSPGARAQVLRIEGEFQFYVV